MRFSLTIALGFLSLAATGCGGAAQVAPSSSLSSPSRNSQAAGVSTAPGVSPPAAASSTLIHIKAAYPAPTVTMGALFVAVDHGFFKNNGLDVSITDIGGNEQVPALLAGELQVAGTGASQVANADLNGASLVMVGTAVDYPFFSLYADKKYHAVKDLQGQAIGITSAGSSTDVAAQLFLQHFGMLGKVKIAPAGGTQAGILGALSKGVVAAGILAPPTTATAAKQGFVELVNGVSLGVPMNTTGLVVTRAYLKDHADVLKRFLKAYQQAWTFNADPANKATVVKILAKYTKSDEAAATIGYTGMLKVWQGSKMPTVNPEAVSNVLKLSPDAKIHDADPKQFFDNSLLQSVQ